MIKILVVDDNWNNLVDISVQLYHSFPKSTIITAASGKEGIEKALAECPDMILLDIEMPVMDGYETCIKLKEDKFLKRIPVILITSSQPDCHTRIKALEAGIEAFLPKPINESELTALISSVIKNRNLENQVLLENEKLEEQLRLRTQELIKEMEERKQLEKTLQEREETYHAFFNNSLDCVYILDLQGHFIDANNAALKLFGYKKEEIQGLSFIALLSEDQLPLVFKISQEIRETGFQKHLVEFRLKLRNGNDVYIETQGSAIISNGVYTGIHTVARNINERKNSIHELRKLFRAVEQSPVSIVITDIEGNIIYGNPKVCALSGYSIGELLVKNPRIFQAGETSKETYKILWDTIRSGKEWQGEFHNKKKNGELFWESVSISPILDSEGTITNFLAVKEDITEQKKMIIKLEEANNKAESGNRLKSAFVNNISHEVRTPLNGILGFSSLIMQPDITEEEKERYHSFIKLSSNRLLNTISNFLDASLIASGNMEVRRKHFNPDSIFHKLFERFKPLCDAIPINLFLKIPQNSEIILIHSDTEILLKVLSHLLDNAIKFTRKGEIVFGYVVKSGLLEFFVKDTGTGISDEAKVQVFENFVQEEASHSRGYEGSGLGLSIAMGLIQLLGGSEIQMESNKGIGSTFYFTLPYKDIASEVKTNEKVKKHVTPFKPVFSIVRDDSQAPRGLNTIPIKQDIKIIQSLNGTALKKLKN